MVFAISCLLGLLIGPEDGGSLFQTHYDPGVDSASNRNEYQESSWELKGGRHVRLTILPPYLSRFSRENMGASTSHKPMDFHSLLQGELYLLP
jgi:hypothetical protein